MSGACYVEVVMVTLRPAIFRIRRVLASAPVPAPIAAPRRRNFADVAAQTIQTDRLDLLVAVLDAGRPRRRR